MAWLNITPSPSIILVLLLGLTTLKLVLLKRTNGKLASELREATTSFERSQKQLGKLQDKQTTADEFQKNLNKAELTAQLQKPRMA